MNRRGMLLAALLVALLAVAALAPAAAMAEGTEDVKIDETNFPDDTFRDYVKNNCDKNRDGYLSEEEIKAVTKIDVPKTLTKDLTGIEYFTELKTLDCSSSYLTELDLSKNTALMDLDCSNSFLTTLDVSGCTALTDLDCSSNDLTTLDLSKNTALMNLECGNNDLTELDVSENKALTDLDCSSNDLTTLDLSENKALMNLDCSTNSLTSLDVSGCAELTALRCNNNPLTALDVTKNGKLEMLYCIVNQLTSLDVTQNEVLWGLDCSNNALTALDVSQNTELQNLDCSGQSVRLEVVRGADETWSADLAALVAGWKEHFETITVSPEEVWDETTDTVAWSKGTVWPTVTYDFDTEFTDTFEAPPLRIKMNVTLTLVPLGVGTEADVTRAVVKGLPGVISGTEITVTLPAGSSLPTAGEIAVTLSRYATMTAPVSTDGGRTWTFTVTSEDGQTVKNYTLYMAYDVTVENEDGHGTVAATPNPAREGDTVTLIVTPDPGYVLAGWEVVLGDVTVGADNTFVMPAGPVILRAIFAPATTATPPQTGDDSHTGLWLALLLVSLGGLCAAAYAVRRRRAR